MLQAAWKSLLGRKLRLLTEHLRDRPGGRLRRGHADLHRHPEQELHRDLRQHGRRRRGAARRGRAHRHRRPPRSRPCRPSRRSPRRGARRRARRRQRDHLRTVRHRQQQPGGRRSGRPRHRPSTRTTPPPRTASRALQVVKGRQPTGEDEVASTRPRSVAATSTSATKVRLVSVGQKALLQPTLVGIADFPDGGSLNGATVSIFDTPTAQKLFLDGKDALQRRLGDREARSLPAGAARPGRRGPARRPRGGHRRQGRRGVGQQLLEAISFLTIFLLVFAGISLVVGSFLIVNTFSMLVAQRSRELALLRALGASRRQVTRSVLFEAFVVGLVGSEIGLGLGVLLAIGIRALFASFGLDLSGTGLVFARRTPLGGVRRRLAGDDGRGVPPRPALRRIPPIAALRDDVAMPESSLRRRLLVGTVMMLVGVAAGAVGLFTDVPKRATGSAGERCWRCWAWRRPARAPREPFLRLVGGALPPALRQHRRARRPELAAQPPAYGGHRLGADDRPHPGHHDVDRRLLGQGERRPHDRAELPRRHRDQQRGRAGLLPAGRDHGREGARRGVGDPAALRPPSSAASASFLGRRRPAAAAPTSCAWTSTSGLAAPTSAGDTLLVSKKEADREGLPGRAGASPSASPGAHEAADRRDPRPRVRRLPDHPATP